MAKKRAKSYNIGLSMPIIAKYNFTRTMHTLRLSVLGMIAAAALLLIRPMGQPSVSFIDWKSWVIFGIVCLLTILPLFIKKSANWLKSALRIISHPILLIILAGVAGYLIYL